MTSNQPYLLRAIHEWILDNELTPHVLVNAEFDQVDVPEQFVKDGQIVLNIAPHAISGLLMDNDAVSFTARFSGIAKTVYIPVYAIKAIYASENGQGMVFPDIDLEEFKKADMGSVNEEKEVLSEVKTNTPTDKEEISESDKKSDNKAPFLKVIK